MDQPILLWVNMCTGLQVVSPPCELTRYSDVRLVDRHQLFAALRIATTTEVVCFDLDEPDMDGLKLVAETKANFPSMPIIMMIDHQTTDVVLWALRTRIFDMLIKPVNAQDVARCMQRLLPALQARRTQSGRNNITQAEMLPAATRYRSRTKVCERLRSVISFVSMHYMDAITEYDMAKLCGMSVFRFSKAFHAEYDVTFRDHLSELRLAGSKRLLGNPKISVSDVAAMSGFNDPSYFARLFRSRFGMSPTRYRRAKILKQMEPMSAEDALDSRTG